MRAIMLRCGGGGERIDFTGGQGCLADLKRGEVHKNLINQLAREIDCW